MKRIFKWAAIIGAALIVIIVVALLLIPIFVDVAKYKPLIEKRVSEAVGRPFSVGDDLRLSLFPYASLKLTDLRMGNPVEFSEKEFLLIKSLEVRGKLWPMIFRDIQVQRFILSEPHIVLVKNIKGHGNWEIPQKPAAPPPGPAPADKKSGFELPVEALAVGDFAINKGTVVWIDHTTGLRKQATDINFKVKDVTLDQPLKIALSGLLDSRSFALQGAIGPIGKQIGQGTVPVDISLTALDEIKMKLKGWVKDPMTIPQADLVIDVAEFSPRKLFAALDQPFPMATADPKVLSRLGFSAGLKADQTSLAISDGKLRLDDSTLNLRLKIVNFAKPDLAFDLTLDKIDADRYLPPKSGDRQIESRPAIAKSKATASKAGPSSAPAAKPFIASVAAVDGRLQAGSLIINQKKVDDILLTLTGKNGPTKMALTARLKEGPLTVNGSIGPFNEDSGRLILPLDIAVNAIDHLKLRANGKVLNPSTQPTFEMSVKIEEFSPRKLLTTFGQPFPIVTSDPAAVNRAALSANLIAASDRASISDGQLIIDDSKMKVTLRAADFSKPDIAFDLAVDQINLDRYLPPQSQEKSATGAAVADSGSLSPQKSTTQPPSTGSETRYEPLHRLIIAGHLQAGKLTVNNLKIQNLQLKINGKNGVINLDPLNMDLYQGNIAGKGHFNVQREEPASDINFTINNVQIGPLLQDAANQDVIEGFTQARISLTMTGDTAERIRQTLNGQGEMKFNDGAVKGFDLAAMARNVESAFGLGAKDTQAGKRPRTDFTELYIPFTITNGIAAISKANMKSPFIRLEASGKADLMKETLDFLVDPKAVGTIKGQGDEKARTGVMVPIIVSGTFVAPKFRPDIKRIITQQIDKGILESEPAKKILEKDEVKKIEEPAKRLLKDLLKKP
ncbi:MAG: AsmA family protein [Deltaproteobacteria bacterium]|nr:AsmA family protein [Deltaproteobacteria bacterium]